MTDKPDPMQTMAKAIDTALNGRHRRFGFTLLIFPFEHEVGSHVNYVSNCDRKDMVAALKEIVAKFEGQGSQVGHG